MDGQLIIFDLDGTLIDSREDLAAAINHTRFGFGLGELPTDEITGYVGNGARKLVERSFAGTGVDIDDALARYKRYYNAHSTIHTCCYAGVEEGVRRLTDAGHKLAVMTNKPGDASRAILEHYGLLPFFVRVTGGGDVPRLKPFSDGIEDCLGAAGAGSDKAWMVGDNYTDLEAAANAGVRSVYVNYGFGERRGLNADLCFDSFGELVDWFCG